MVVFSTKVLLNGDDDNNDDAGRDSESAGAKTGPDSSSSSFSDPKECVMDSASRVGLDYIVENPDYVQKLASALESKNLAVKKQVFELLAALSVYSNEGYARTLQALDAFKTQIGERYRFKFLLAELLTETSSIDYKTSILAFINCLILACPDASERTRTRCEFIGLKLSQVLNDLRHKHKGNPGLIIQLDVFDEQKESDESQALCSASARGIDLSSPLEVFDAILRQIADNPQEVPFLCILQHLLSIDTKEPISDLIWDAAERLVHRATLLESRDDALRLLKTPSHPKSLHKLKGLAEPRSCACACKCGNKVAPPLGRTPPPPPPPMIQCPPAPPAPPPTPPNHSTSTTTTTPNELGRQKPLPKLPQQSIPCPKAKMKTVNWNKIPNGQIMNTSGQNLWTTFSSQQANGLLDWNELEGLFCLQNGGGVEASALGGNSNYGYGAATTNLEFMEKNSTNASAGKNHVGSSELILLDAKRSLNINIFLKQFKSSNADIVQLILNGASQDFGSERLRGLLKLLPAQDESEMLNLVSSADQSRLGSAEKFLLSLIQINNYRLRIEAMLLREELEICVANIDSSIHAILQAATDVKNSEQFQQVVFMILVAGNFLNSGGYAGDAAGVKLSSLQKIGDIRGNKPGVSLLHFIVMQAEVRDSKLISFVNDMPALEEASKTSIEQLKSEISTLDTKVSNMTLQMESAKIPKDILSQYGSFFKQARHKIATIDSYFTQVDVARVDLAGFFCEELSSFKLEDCFKIIYAFINKWREAANDNAKRRKMEADAETRRKTREEQFKKRSMLGLSTNQQQQQPQLSNEDMSRIDKNMKGMTLSPDDDLFIACSPRIVRRRLGSLSGHDNMSSGSTQGSNDQLALPSPEITPNGSLRKRRSRLSSDEDESNLMNFLRSSGGHNTPTGGPPTPATNNPHIGSPSTPRKLPGAIIDNQYGSLDRSWSRGTRRRPNLMDFVNSDRERPISPAAAAHGVKSAADAGGSGRNGGNNSNGNGQVAGSSIGEHKHDSPAREWRERITAWFVDLENGGNGAETPKRRPPPRRFQSRLGDSIRSDTNGGLATLPEVETNPEELTVPSNNSLFSPRPTLAQAPSTHALSQQASSNAAAATKAPSTYERVYPDRRPSLKVNTDVVSAMEAIEEAQSPLKEKTLWRTTSMNSNQSEPPIKSNDEAASRQITNGRRSLISSLGGNLRDLNDEKLTLYIPDGGPGCKKIPGPSKCPDVVPIESDFGSKEGFDRFASIRRSRRIKKGAAEPDSHRPPSSFGRTPPGPDTPIPTRRFISKIDITDGDGHGGPDVVKPLNEAPSLFLRSNRLVGVGVASKPKRTPTPRSSSLIEPRHVQLALNTAARQSSNFIPIPNAVTPTKMSKNSSSTTTPLSSSPGTITENDEGFEESPNSLTETNGDLAPNSNSHQNNIKQLSKSSAISNNGLFSMPPLIRRKSRQENVPLIDLNVNNNNNTNNTLGGNNRKPFTSNINTSNLLISARNAKNGPAVGRNGVGPAATTATTPSDINHESTTMKSGISTKSRTPRILSFMRPTASSSAKDKLEAATAAAAAAAGIATSNGISTPAATTPATPNGKVHKLNNVSNALYTNRRAFK